MSKDGNTQTNHQNKILLDISDVCEALGISRQSTYNLITSGELPSLVVGKRRRKVSRKALDDYIARAESASSNAA